MSPLHLLWIVPLSASLGTITAALAAAAGREDRALEALREKTVKEMDKDA